MPRKRVDFDDRLLGRIHGCLAGVAVGDAFGMPMAGWTPAEVKRRYGHVTNLIAPAPDHPLHGKLPLGSITDDAQLTMAIVDMILVDGAVSRHGLRVGVADAIGDDDLGAFYRAGLEAEGVDTSRLWVREGGRTTGCLVLLTRRGRHAYVGLEGVSGTYTPDELDEGYVSGARSLLMSGYPLAENPIASAVAKAMRAAKRAGRTIFFDPSPVADSIQPDLLREAVESAHTIILNEREMGLIASTLKVEPNPSSLLDLGAKRVVLKRGAEGCTFHTPSGAVDYPGFKVKVVDTTGAGDSLDAAIVYGTLRGWGDDDTATLANASGAVKVGKKGGGRNVPTRAELVGFLEERGLALASEL